MTFGTYQGRDYLLLRPPCDKVDSILEHTLCRGV